MAFSTRSSSSLMSGYEPVATSSVSPSPTENGSEKTDEGKKPEEQKGSWWTCCCAATLSCCRCAYAICRDVCHFTVSGKIFHKVKKVRQSNQDEKNDDDDNPTSYQRRTFFGEWAREDTTILKKVLEKMPSCDSKQMRVLFAMLGVILLAVIDFTEFSELQCLRRRPWCNEAWCPMVNCSFKLVICIINALAAVYLFILFVSYSKAQTRPVQDELKDGEKDLSFAIGDLHQSHHQFKSLETSQENIRDLCNLLRKKDPGSSEAINQIDDLSKDWPEKLCKDVMQIKHGVSPENSTNLFEGKKDSEGCWFSLCASKPSEPKLQQMFDSISKDCSADVRHHLSEGKIHPDKKSYGWCGKGPLAPGQKSINPSDDASPPTSGKNKSLFFPIGLHFPPLCCRRWCLVKSCPTCWPYCWVFFPNVWVPAYLTSIVINLISIVCLGETLVKIFCDMWLDIDLDKMSKFPKDYMENRCEQDLVKVTECYGTLGRNSLQVMLVIVTVTLCIRVAANLKMYDMTLHMIELGHHVDNFEKKSHELRVHAARVKAVGEVFVVIQQYLHDLQSLAIKHVDKQSLQDKLKKHDKTHAEKQRKLLKDLQKAAEDLHKVKKAFEKLQREQSRNWEELLDESDDEMLELNEKTQKKEGP